MESGAILRGRLVVLRPVAANDVQAITALLQDPTIARWWGAYDAAKVRDEFIDDVGDGAKFIVEVDGALAGIIQYGEELDPMYHHASIDLALGEAFQGRGIGPDAIRAVAHYLFGERGHHRITIDPAADNRNAIRAYESVGFRPVGLMRQYERGLDGAWHDGLLMDLIAGELLDG